MPKASVNLHHRCLACQDAGGNADMVAVAAAPVLKHDQCRAFLPETGGRSGLIGERGDERRCSAVNFDNVRITVQRVHIRSLLHIILQVCDAAIWSLMVELQCVAGMVVGCGGGDRLRLEGTKHEVVVVEEGTRSWSADSVGLAHSLRCMGAVCGWQTCGGG